MPFFKKSKHMKIVPNQDFLHERDRYDKGQTYTVEISLGRYFEKCGWLQGPLRKSATSTNLDIHDATLGHWGKM